MVFSQGFNPIPKVSFSPALPVGTESLAEYIDVEFYKAVSTPEALLERMNQQMPAGLQVTSVAPLSGRSGAHANVLLVDYEITLPRILSAEEEAKVAQFIEEDSFVVKVTRKGKMRALDVRPQISELNINSAGKRILFRLRHDIAPLSGFQVQYSPGSCFCSLPVRNQALYRLT